MVRVYPARNYSSIYLVEDIQPASRTLEALFGFTIREEKVLPVYGVTKDSMESTLAKVMETHP